MMAVNWLVLGCKTLRDGVFIAAVFFVGSMLLFLAARYVVPDLFYFQHLVLFCALVLIVLAPIVLVSTFLLSILPGARAKMEKCEH